MNIPTASSPTRRTREGKTMAANITPTMTGTDENGFPVSYEDHTPDTFRLGEDDAADTQTEKESDVTATATKPTAAKSKTPPVSHINDPAAKNGKPKQSAAGAPTGNKNGKGSKPGARHAAKPNAGEDANLSMAVPKGTIKTIPFKELVFDKRVQMRSSLFDESTVEEYRELMKEDGDADRFPPLRAVEISADEQKELGLDSPFVVWDGFQRGEAIQRNRFKEVGIEIIKGDWLLVKRLALLANRDHGMKRSKADIRKLFEKFIADETLVNKVLAEGKGKGGANRAIATAVGISKGAVNNYLAAMGKGTQGDKIVNKTPPQTRPEQRVETDRIDPASPKFKEDMATIRAKHDAVLIQEMCNAIASFQRRYEAILERADVANLVREEAMKQGYPIKRDENPTKEAGNAATVIQKTEYWPACDYLLSIMDAVKEAHAATVTKTTTA